MLPAIYITGVIRFESVLESPSQYLGFHLGPLFREDIFDLAVDVIG